MFEKNLEMSQLLDFYGETLSERKLSVTSLYYNEDLSLAEVADEIGISRQGVRELIKKAEKELTELEEKLGLAERFNRLRALADITESVILRENTSDELRNAVNELVSAVRM